MGVLANDTAIANDTLTVLQSIRSTGASAARPVPS